MKSQILAVVLLVPLSSFGGDPHSPNDLFKIFDEQAAQTKIREKKAPDQSEKMAGPENSRPSKYLGVLLGASRITTGNQKNYFSYSGRGGINIFESNSFTVASGIYLSSIAVGLTTIMTELGTRHLFSTGAYFAGRIGLGVAFIPPSTARTLAYSPGIGFEFVLDSHAIVNVDFSWITLQKGSTNPRSSAVVLNAGILCDW